MCNSHSKWLVRQANRAQGKDHSALEMDVPWKPDQDRTKGYDQSETNGGRDIGPWSMGLAIGLPLFTVFFIVFVVVFKWLGKGPA